MITVYTKSGCPQCDATKRKLDNLHLTYIEVELTTEDNADARTYVTGTLGYTSAPVVETSDGDHWSGYRPDRLQELAQETDDRIEFLVDVLSTAVEVGVSYWGATIHVEDHTGTTPEGDNLDPIGTGGDCYAATIRDYETGTNHHVNLGTIARGARLLANSTINNQLVNDFREANSTNGDRGDIDAANADMALQMGIFGDVIYS